MSDTIFADTAPSYYSRGLPVIPLYSREKKPVPEGWSRFHDMEVDPEDQKNWIDRCAGGNIGIVLGQQSGMSMLDIDTEDPALIQLIQSLVPTSPWRRIGQKGAVLAFRWNGLKTFRIKTASGATVCELLSDRTQVVLPPSIHPKTQMPYQANCNLLDVIDHLPMLDLQIEAILRGALKVAGVELSLSGSSKVTDFVSSGSRDTTLTEMAGLFAYAVMRGERTLKEAVGMLRSYEGEFVEQVAGDSIDSEKHVANLIRFLHRDVFEKNKQLPEGWDLDLTEEEKTKWGLQFSEEHVEWSFDELRDHLRDEFERFPLDTPGRMGAVDYTLSRIARSHNLTSLEEGRILQYIADVSGSGVRVPMLRTRLRELRQVGIVGADHSEIAKAVIEDLEQTWVTRRHGGSVWKYNGSHWEVIAEEWILSKIANDYGSLLAGKRHSDHRGILATLKNMLPSGIKTVELRGVNFANGFLGEDLVLRDHDESFGMTYTLPFRYMPGMAGNSPHFFGFLADCWGRDVDGGDKIMALQEALCVTLFGLGPRFQRVMLLKGVAGSGKSQLLRIAQSLVPDDAKCFVPPNEWADKFLPTQMYEKLINVCGELSEKKHIDGQRFKDIVDGSEMNGQHKGQQIFKFRPICTHWFASNHTPKTTDSSEGFNRRWLMFEFNFPVPPEKRRVDMADIIVSEEREAIVAWAVLAMPRLIENQEYTLPVSHKQMIKEVAQANNSVRFFMEESPRVRVSQSKTGTYTTEVVLYKEYWTFCLGLGGAKPVGSREFRQRMRELQPSLGFEMSIVTSAFGTQDIHYNSVTLVTA